MKKGDTWVSAVLYIALGTIVVTMLLAAGMPAINKIRDRNIIVQSKDIMFGINSAVRTIINEGPGSQRSFIVDIGKGSLVIDESRDIINWSMQSKAVVSEVGRTVNEGDLMITAMKTNKANEYNVAIALDYSSIADVSLVGDRIVTGRRNLIIGNKGIDGSGKAMIEIRIAS